MQAIEFESTVQDQAIPLPTAGMLSPGQPVRVVVMFDELAPKQSRLMPEESALASRRDAISELCENPLVLPGFVPLSRDETHDR